MKRSLINLLADELEFSTETLKINPKCYPAWYHRRWLFCQVPPQIGQMVAPNELRLCSKLLQMDSRNFHCWTYRSFICDRILNRTVVEELQFTKEMISRDFSNYSAWHRRAVVLLRMDDGEKQAECFEQDLEMVKSAVYTDPHDQSAWFYLCFLLLENYLKKQRGKLLETIQCLEELYSDEPECSSKPHC